MSSIEILVPDLPESVVDATVTSWHKKPGEQVQLDEILVEIETDKVVLEIPAPKSGILEIVLEDEGAIVSSRQVLGRLCQSDDIKNVITKKHQTQEMMISSKKDSSANVKTIQNDSLSPSVRRLISANDLIPEAIKGSGIGGRLTQKDLKQHMLSQDIENTSTFGNRSEKRVPMTRLRKRVAERLLEAKNNTAMLTTFNEVNMKSIMDLRKNYGTTFETHHGVRLGLMSFCVKAVLNALKYFPEVNAYLDGEDNIIYHNYFDINIAVSTSRGLVTPVLKNVDLLSMANIETQIKELATKGRDGKLTVEELTSGNFTITNSGIFGSLMSTPIINPPQSAILGMHTIKDRPIAMDEQIVIMPMMYLALSYDHRIIDGKESVSFLLAVKEVLEDPIRLLLDI
ncbi:2-oxoglutarate dehydrogenase complex dihydrolipoyllysine-residue succinyltransferase [Candidatus Curculioniphilus buchneri]|uniref:2-oxoglutarate dehydrogenase complex dihydrolipoyllysine-residue succinyltransferase n=1 Tax=Candidatus Curculioniphilus buchneri TaxID=690594 RepID=UPI00376ECDFC